MAELPIPIEIPWKLASTTQPLAAGEPRQTSMSLFYFEPDEELLTSDFPDEKLIFLKVTASVSPAAFPANLSRVAAGFLGEGIPCYHVLLDMKVREEGVNSGTTRPYFHNASPLNRRMLQTGVVGIESFEGSSDGLSVGKSGSQMFESLRSNSTTTGAGGSAGVSFGIGPVGFSLGGSVSTSTTDVASNRAVRQVVDSTTRQASDERRELISHTTKVENVLTLLSAKYVGTPHLSFSLMPQPLQMLSVDPSDPNIWFQQLLSRRSTGIEGIQEFISVIVVPRAMNFCVNARLRRVCLLDSPPGPLTLSEQFSGSLLQLFRMIQYLNRTFPPGTPLEDLDIDITSGLNLRRPVVRLWAFRLGEDMVEALVVSPGTLPGIGSSGRANYKSFLEVWLDTLRDEYEREVARSPLERGALIGENLSLDTCFAAATEESGISVTGSNTTVSPLFRIRIPVEAIDIGGSREVSPSASPRARAIETVTRWNAIEKQLGTLLSNRVDLPQKPLTLSDPTIFGVLMDTWSKLGANDSRNSKLEDAADTLGLDDGHRAKLKSSGATDLKGIAMAMRASGELELYNAEILRLKKQMERSKFQGAPLEPVKFGISSDDSDKIKALIARRLAEAGDEEEPDA